MDGRDFPSKTYSPADLHQPQIAPTARALRRFAFRLGLKATRFSVNGVLHWRFRVREHKLWEYARGLACVLPTPPAGPVRLRVLDFGGAGTLPVFYLAQHGCEVLCPDIDPALTEWTNRVARDRGWNLRASTHDLVSTPAPSAWGRFDAVVSFSVLEHIAPPQQPFVLKRLAELLRPGGIFALTFDFGLEAPVEGAVRDPAHVERLVAATELAYLDGAGFLDTGERFHLDKRHPHRRFTFASVFLKKKLDP